MAKGAKRKTKWVSLSLANANTKTSNAVGSDSEQAVPHHPQNYGEGHRNKMLNGSSLASKPSKDLIATTDALAEHGGNERTQDHQSGNRTDTSTGSDCVAGSERRPMGSYHRRRPPPYNTRTNWSGGVSTGSSNGRNHYHRNGYYGNGGNGHYGTGKRSHYDYYTRRQQTTATTATNRTTSGEGGETGGTTINDDEYTRITTPRQDVLFKKGYLSRPKPSVATASTSNTGSSSIAGTTSEGSDGGNGGSNSISTTESITSEYGGSYAADGSQLLDYPFPCIPCGYFTENGVLVMNGFAVDNNGFSYFNGGQTYIYPPNYNNCQQSPETTTLTTGDQTTDSNMLYANDDTNDEINANESTDIDERSMADHSTPVIDTEAVPVYNENGGDTAGDGQFFINDGLASMEQVAPLCEVVPEQIVPNGSDQLAGVLVSGAAENETAASNCVQEVQDFSENGYFPYTNGYDFAQFYNSLCYPGWMMDQQYRLYDDAGLPLYCGSEYAITNEETYGHQPSFKKRKKRFRTFEEMPSGNDNSYDVEDATSTTVDESNTTGSGDATECVPETYVPSSDVCHQSHQLNAEVQEFQPSTIQPNTATIVTNPSFNKSGDVCETLDKTNNNGKSHVSARNRHQAASKLTKSSFKTVSSDAIAAAQSSDDASNVPPVSANGKFTATKANRKKDLIEATLAFAAQNIDLTRPKAAASQAPSHDSELFWTTIDRNGRKKRIAMVPEQEPVTAIETEKESSSVERTNEKSTVGDTMQKSEAPLTVLQDNSPTAESQPLSVSNVVATDASGKKEPQTKSKKKTHKHKRQQQLRKSVGNFNKQPLEGFQLIEPEFASSTAGHRRGKSSDKAGRVEPTAQKAHDEAVQMVQENNDKETSCTESLDQNECRVVEEQPETMDKTLNCDKSSNDAPSEASSSEEKVEVEEVEEEVVALKMVPQLASASALRREANLNETETENHHQHQLTTLAVVEKAQNEELEAETAEKEANKPVIENEEEAENNIKQVVDGTEGVLEEIDQKVVESKQESIEVGSSPTNQVSGVDEKSVAAHDDVETNEVQSPAIEEQQIMNIQLSVDTHVFAAAAAAAKQLAISPISLNSPTLPALEEDEAEDHADVADDGIGSEGDDMRTKRGSMSGAGYTESIDSGLQSPAPCGGVASPETSSMVSSIESQPAIDLPEVDSTQSALSQVVGTWLMSKLQVHEPEEVFVLPSNPLLIQRLERFHQLQRRERCERLRGAVTSESEGEDEEYDLEDDDDDADSDYMSDGQGRIDRTQSDDANSSNPGSPLNSLPQQEAASVVQKSHLDDAQTGSQLANESKRHAIQHSDSGNSGASVPRAADSKRCLIM